ncbi:helix-turn-helix transcriptional regulator [Polaromonas sp. JS666]|uniref:helix-turn-helix transcriptional regulator n=1 Tax=Polaromonas sp. (strain JS666 / ATCC BAA-500) TaxID=296591 RepID=UPI00059CF4E5|nr:AlpA family phage regulatory protein [Polaromonas sp. JS666]
MIATKEESNDLRLLRESQILELIPVSRSTFRRWVKAGKFPAGFKVSERITMWYSYVVFDWIKSPPESPEVRQW